MCQKIPQMSQRDLKMRRMCTCSCRGSGGGVQHIYSSTPLNWNFRYLRVSQSKQKDSVAPVVIAVQCPRPISVSTSGCARIYEYRHSKRLQNVFGLKICRKSELALRSRIVFASPKLCTDLDRTLLYILRVELLSKTGSGYPKDAKVTLFTLATPGSSLRFNTHWSAQPVFDSQNMYQIRLENSNFSVRCLSPVDMLERWLQVSRVKIMFTVLPTNRFVSTTIFLMKCVVNWIPLRIHVRSRNTQPHLNESVVVQKS